MILSSLALFIGLIIGAIRGIQVGESRGREKERIQVIAFLIAEYRSEEHVEPIAKRINNREHHKWSIRW